MRSELSISLVFCFVLGILHAGMAVSADAADQATAPDGPPGGASLRIATWNIEHLGVGEESCLLRSGDDFRALRSYARELDADVVALQEVASLAAAQRVFPVEEYDIVLAAHPNRGARPLCWLEPPLTRSEPVLLGDQFTGFAIRKGVPYEVHADVRGFGDLAGPPGRGAYVAADVSVELGEARLRLLSVHLLWGCSAPGDESREACEPVFRQARALRAWVDERVDAGDPFALLGDFNRPWDEDARYWQLAFALDRKGPGVVPSSASLDLDCHDMKDRGRSFIDHVFLFGEGWSERADFGQLPIVRFDHRNYKISDHCPVFVDLAAGRSFATDLRPPARRARAAASSRAR